MSNADFNKQLTCLGMTGLRLKTSWAQGTATKFRTKPENLSLHSLFNQNLFKLIMMKRLLFKSQNSINNRAGSPLRREEGAKAFNIKRKHI